jgi:ribosomal protein S26
VDMVQCKQCGTHLPRHEALCDSDDYFCSQEHLLEYKKDISH